MESEFTSFFYYNPRKMSLFFLMCLTTLVSAKTNSNKDEKGITFIENKGQVCDQNYKPQANVLYSGTDGKMVYHIKKNGISYQLSKITEWTKKHENFQTKEKVDSFFKATIYRIDINWLNSNPNFEKENGSALLDYNNYYLTQCPNGILNVKSYNEIAFLNIYKNIDLHYYGKNGVLKYDYIIQPHSDYKQIQLEVKGADIQLQADGSLMLKSPLGAIHESAPIAYQNGKSLKAKWQIKENILSFEVENYDPTLELIIDPPVRVWGTYCGGIGNENSSSSAADLLGNVYLSGSTDSNTSIALATSGSHQTSFAGGSYDAFLTKFDSNGLRLWATYYGGAGNDTGLSCATDASGNVYLTGGSYASIGSSIATLGSHQSVAPGSNDAYLVKFNSAGVRLWATYYGGTGTEFGNDCSADAFGNVYIAGYTNLSAASDIATVGSHQNTNGGGSSDAFLVKFNSVGIRLWGTFYGGSGIDQANCCTTDASGNVYLAGETYLSTGTVIATSGCHQSAQGGGTDAFLVKFDSNGVRQWGTFYGGTGYDNIKKCVSDSVGNLYIVGSTSTSGGAVISSAGGYQSAYGGNFDGFLAKFNSAGLRQWGTYYGGTSNDYAYSCVVDTYGNINMAGATASTNNTVMTTSNSHQNIYGGGGSDGFLARFSPVGQRIWATYYGGGGDDLAYSCVSDASGNVYLAGKTDSGTGTSIASSNSFQNALGGGNDAFLAKFDACDSLTQPLTIEGITAICNGVGILTYSVPAVYKATGYNWVLPNGWIGSSSSNIITTTPNGNGGSIVVIATNSCAVSPSQTLSVNVYTINAPSIVVSSGTICSGQSFTIAPTGASNYTFSSNSAVVSPVITSSYSVIGTNSVGCSSISTLNVFVMPSPSLNLIYSSTSICLGSTATALANGAITYLWSNGSNVNLAYFSPTVTTAYTVTGSNLNNCIDIETFTISVNSNPTLSISSTETLICNGESTTLTVNGASSYTWQPYGTGMTSVVSPTSTTSFIIVGENNTGCRATTNISLNVSDCTNIFNNSTNAISILKIYPNPNQGILNIEFQTPSKVQIYDAVGKELLSSEIEAGKTKIDLSKFENGIYFIRVGILTTKFIKVSS